MIVMAATFNAVPADDLYLDFSGLHGTGQLSDIDVVIKEEDGEAGAMPPQAKRARLDPDCEALEEGAVVPAHKMLLWSVSKFFQAKVHYARQIVNHMRPLYAYRLGASLLPT